MFLRFKAATVTILAVAAGITTGPAGASSSSPIDYVQLGDSFSSASGVQPMDWTSPLCSRSLINYGHIIARTIGANLTDVSCGGATTNDLTTSQFPGTAPQLDAVIASTDLVTLTIGGNDNATLASAVLACGSVGILTAGVGSPCKDIYGDTFVNLVKTKTYPAVRKVLAAIHAKAPHAKVAILGYPSILPATKGCFPTMPVAAGDVPYLRSLQATLNGVIKQAARDTHSTFVDFSKVSEGHDACQADGVRWIEPIVANGAAPIHPNALGEAQMANHTLRVLGLS